MPRCKRMRRFYGTPNMMEISGGCQNEEAAEQKPEREQQEETSDTDNSDAEYDPIEHEKRRDKNLRMIVVAEHEFTLAKAKLREIRLKELHEKRSQILKECSKEFIQRSWEIEAEKDNELKECESLYALSLDSLNRQKTAWETTTPHLEDANLEDIRTKLLQIAQDEFDKLQADSLQAQLGVMRFSKKSQIDKRRTLPQAEFLIEHYKKHLRLPSIVEQISKEKMEEDLRFFCLLEACSSSRVQENDGGNAEQAQQQGNANASEETEQTMDIGVEYEESVVDEDEMEEGGTSQDDLHALLGDELLLDVVGTNGQFAEPSTSSSSTTPDINDFQFDFSSPLVKPPQTKHLKVQQKLVK